MLNIKYKQIIYRFTKLSFHYENQVHLYLPLRFIRFFLKLYNIASII